MSAAPRLPYFFFQRRQLASTIPVCRQTSATGVPDSATPIIRQRAGLSPATMSSPTLLIALWQSLRTGVRALAPMSASAPMGESFHTEGRASSVFPLPSVASPSRSSIRNSVRRTRPRLYHRESQRQFADARIPSMCSSPSVTGRFATICLRPGRARRSRNRRMPEPRSPSSSSLRVCVPQSEPQLRSTSPAYSTSNREC